MIESSLAFIKIVYILLCAICRWIIYIEKIAVLIHRNVLGDPQPLINIEKKKKPLLNLNLNENPSRMFNSIEQLENILINVKDLNKQPNGYQKLDCIISITNNS